MADEKGPAPQDLSKPLQADGPNIAAGVAVGVWDEAKHLFNGQAFSKMAGTITGKNAYETEHVEAAYNLLKTEGMIDANAMNAMKAGQHQEVIRGNSALQVTLDRDRYIEGNDVLRVQKDQHEEVHGNSNLAFFKNRYIAVNLSEEKVILMDYDFYVRNKSTEMYVGQHEVTAPEGFEWK